MIQTRWCKYYVVCSHCYKSSLPFIAFIHHETWPETCDKCGHLRYDYTVEMVPDSWREEGYF